MSLKYSNSGGAQLSTSWTLKCTDLPQFDALQAAAEEFEDGKLHLRNLCNDSSRVAGLVAIHTSSVTPSRKMILDYSRQRITGEVAELLYDLADAMSLTDRIKAMRQGFNINATENRPVLHHLFRVPLEVGPSSPDRSRFGLSSNYNADSSQLQPSSKSQSATSKRTGKPAGMLSKPETVQRQSSSRTKSVPPTEASTSRILKEIFQIRDKIQIFANQVHASQVKGATGHTFKHFVVVGSSACPQGLCSVAHALKTGDPLAQASAENRTLHFLDNIDPSCVAECTRSLVPDETLVLVMSKTFTESDVLLNVRTLRQWLARQLRVSELEVNHHHLVAISCNPTRCAQFGIPKDRVFRLMEWTVPRFATCSAIGLLPLALVFGWDVCARLLQGCHDMDEHFFHAPLRDNIPVILGLLGFWNSTFLGYPCRAVVPYSEALRHFPEFVQQVDMESNGKRVALDGTCLLHKSAEVNFGGAATSCQSVFFQLLHQGRVIPVDFIGFMEGSVDVELPEEAVSNHDELMSNFFAQPDALAYGKTLVDLIQEGAPEPLREHMVFTGNRPSSSILMTKLDAFALGQLLALYEHRTAVQGFLWGLNSFDQFGLELGRTMVKNVRSQISATRKTGASVQGFNYSTSSLLEHYLAHAKQSQTPSFLESSPSSSSSSSQQIYNSNCDAEN